MQFHDLKWLEQEIRLLIVETLKLEDLEADDIDPDMPLFGGGLGLSSVNALALDAALVRHFAGLRGGDSAPRAGSVDLFRYSTVRLLAEHLGDSGSPEQAMPVARDVGARRRAALLEKNNGRKA
ncbi:phosphopantetheine-binding protein [Stenotrophomonas sp. NPDC077464]|uniref:phosphopantetheine-binding protein n=1 Tax=unclassified Stenotrophomonas TaxID=196198 RepID=UPI0037D58E35